VGDSDAGNEGDGDERFLWGTNIRLGAAMAVFRRFLTDYSRETETTDVGAEGKYARLLGDMQETEDRSLFVDCQELGGFEPGGKELLGWLIQYPQEIITIMDTVANQVFEEICASNGLEGDAFEGGIQVKVYNIGEPASMRELGPGHIDTLVAIEGMITRCSSIIPDIRVAYFRCSTCGDAVQESVKRGRVEEPNQCANCGSRNSHALIHNRSIFKDKQLIKLQESPSSVPKGQTPRNVTLYAFEELCDSVVPGDRVVVTGIHRALAHRPNPRMRAVLAKFKTYLDVLHFRKMGATQGVTGDVVDAYNAAPEATPEQWEEKREMAATPELYTHLAASLAPGIWELEDVKKGILLQLFGGVPKNLGSQGKFRGEVNVLLCGDPGTSKSQMLGYVKNISPRGMYTSGKGSSAVGLTAYITKDPETRQPVLESGALVLCDRGVCCIDEFDKMDDSTRSILHEVMEQQTLSVAKAGIIATLNARTSILASVNPVDSRYNPTKSVVENIKLPPTLLSRFDLIYLILDKPDPISDRRLAQHLVSMYFPEGQRSGAGPTFPRAQLTDYIAFARKYCNPVISDEALNELVSGYVDMRQLGAMGGKKTITATPRQLESLIRLAEAHARLHLKDTVDGDDVKEALRLMAVATQSAAMDPRTGAINMDMIATGRSAADGEMLVLLVQGIEEALEGARGGKIKITALQEKLESANNVPVEKALFDEALKQLKDDGSIRLHNGTVIKQK
jgi:DNA replication licensing factor MCM4